MFVQFEVENFLSFKDNVTFSMVGYPPIKELEDGDEFCNVINDSTGKGKYLKSSVIYGSNGSGKSNLLAAMSFFKKFILTSSNESQANDEISAIPFLLSTETENEPSSFEMIFLIKNKRYRYGFEADSEKIHAEWLFCIDNKPSAKEAKLFVREFQEISPNSRTFKEGKGLENNTRSNALFLSVVAQLNGEISNEILEWFRGFEFISGLNENTLNYTINKFINNEGFRVKVNEFFKAIDIGFESMEIIEADDIIGKSLQNIPNELKNEIEEVFSALKKLQEKSNEKKEKKGVTTKSVSVQIGTFHKKFDDALNFLELQRLDWGLQSKGTKKLFSLLGPIDDVIQSGKILVIDELDSRLHSLLTIELVRFFHAKANNKAQLIFASHDTNLLKKELFRRDQIWFTEKDKYGSTDLYSLVEYKVNQSKVRNDASFEKDYLLGKYGAIPFLGNIQKFITDFLYEQEK